MNSYYAVPATSDEIYHHGIIGQKWGVRRYQNPDGSLTPAGKARYSQNEKIVETKYGITNGAFSKEKYLKSIDNLNNQIESLEIKKEDKNSLRQIFNTERIDREYKRDAHYGTLDDQELLELLTMEHEAFNEECKRIINKYNSKKVNNIIDRIKSFDTYTDGHFSDYKKGNEYMFEDDFVKIYENGIKGRELKHHGIIGQKWGVRRYQNPDGSLTDLGKKRLAKDIVKTNKRMNKEWGSDRSNLSPLGTKYSDEIDPRSIKNLDAIKDALANYKDARNKYKDFYDSDEAREASNRAYNDTVKFFKKYDPDYLKDALRYQKEHGEHPKEYEGHPKKDLTGFHDFGKVYEGYENKYWEEAEKKYLNSPEYKRGKKIKEDAWNNYVSECKKAAYDLVGEYGNKRINALGDGREPISINDIAAYSVRELVRWNRN